MNKRKIVIAMVAVVAVVALGMKGKGVLESRKAKIANEAPPKIELITIPIVKAREGILKKNHPI